MNPLKLTFTANEQDLTKTDNFTDFASNTVSYIEATFTLGENWTGYDSVRAVWKTDYYTISTVLDANFTCIVPTEVLRYKAKVFVNLVGSIVENDTLTDRLTTFPVLALTVKANAAVNGTETVPVTPSQFEQFVEAVQDAAGSISDYSYDSEAWAVGKRGGVDVPSTDETYHNNSKYWAEQNAGLADDVADLKEDFKKELRYLGYDVVSINYTTGTAHSSLKDKVSLDIKSGEKINIAFSASTTSNISFALYAYYNGDNVPLVKSGVTITNGFYETSFISPANIDSIGIYIPNDQPTCMIEFCAYKWLSAIDSTKVLKSNLERSNLGNDTLDMYSPFVNGSLYNGAITSDLYRVVSINNISFDRDVKLVAEDGFKFGVHTFVDGEFSIDSGWQTNYVISAGTIFKITIAKVTEDSQIADVFNFVRRVNFLTAANANVENSINEIKMIANHRFFNDLFAIGSLYNGVFIGPPTYKYRIATPNIIKFSDEITLSVMNGYVYGVHVFSDDNVFVSDSGWQYGNLTIPANQKFRITIRKNPEETNTPNISEYVNAVSISGEATIYFGNGVEGDSFAINQTRYSTEKTSILPTPPASLSASSYQGFGFNNGVLFQFYSDDMVELIDYANGSLIADIQSPTGHGNAIGFLASYFDNADEFPTAIVSDTLANPKAYHVRITRSAVALLKTIIFPVNKAGYYANVMVDALNNILYTVGYTESSWTDNTSGNNRMIFAKWNWDNLTDNGDSTFTPEFLGSFTTPFMHTMQGSVYRNGKLFVVSSRASGSDAQTKIYVVDPFSERIQAVMSEFPSAIKNIEVEAVCFADHDGESFALVKPNSTSEPYYKILFNQ